MLRPLVERLEVVRLDRASAPLGVMPEVRERLGVDAALFARFVPKPGGWGVEGIEADGVASLVTLRRAAREYLASRLRPVPWVDFMRPGDDHVNKAVVIDARTLRQSDVVDQVLAPASLAGMHIVRALLCDDSGPRAWLGGFARFPIREPQRALLDHLVAPLLVRMRIEGALCAAPRVQRSLEVVLQQIEPAACVVDSRARILDLNSAARELVARRRSALIASVNAALQRAAPALPISLTPLAGAPANPQYLVVVWPRGADVRVVQARAIAALLGDAKLATPQAIADLLAGI